MSKKWEYLIHTTMGLMWDEDIITRIVESGFLWNPQSEKRTDFKSYQKKINKLSETELKELKESDEHIAPFFYTQYIYSDLPLQPNQQWSYGIMDNFKGQFEDKTAVFIIDIDALKKFPFYICKFVNYGMCLFKKEDIILHSLGNLKRKPNLSKLKKFIELLVTHPKANKSYGYWASHEILFEYIPVSFIKAIAGNFSAKQHEEYTKLFKKHKLDIKLVPLSPDFHKVFDNI